MFTVNLADHIFVIDNKYEYVKKLCKDYMTEPENTTSLCMSEECHIACSIAEILAENRDGKDWSKGYLESLAIYRKICEYLLADDILLFHCSALAIDGKTILFTAPSGTGKSTHARLWGEQFGERVTMVNDDKPLLKIEEKSRPAVTVYGTPYGGKDNLQTNTSAPVVAVVILHQADENSIKLMNRRDAYPMLLNQT